MTSESGKRASKKYREKNKEKVKAADRAYYYENRAKRNSAARAWYYNNRESVRVRREKIRKEKADGKN